MLLKCLHLLLELLRHLLSSLLDRTLRTALIDLCSVDLPPSSSKRPQRSANFPLSLIAHPRLPRPKFSISARTRTTREGRMLLGGTKEKVARSLTLLR